jgi:vacuolar protein sorting-associated protein 13A/C
VTLRFLASHHYSLLFFSVTGGALQIGKGIGKGITEGDGRAVASGLVQGATSVGTGVGQGVESVVMGVGEGVVTAGQGVFSGVMSIGKGIGDAFQGKKSWHKRSSGRKHS